MEIINPNTLPGNNGRSCSTDALAPEHTCYDGGNGCINREICVCAGLGLGTFDPND